LKFVANIVKEIKSRMGYKEFCGTGNREINTAPQTNRMTSRKKTC
jgi:hypothetical protein